MKIGLRTVKTAICAVVAMVLAQGLGLLYAPSAGIIAVLSVGNTKRSSFVIALNRVVSLVLAMGIAGLCFFVLGYGPVAFGVYLLLFIPVSTRFQLDDGIVVNSVLMTHFLVEQNFSLAMITNEFLLMGIGAGLALVANLYMPDLEKTLREDQLVVEAMFARLLELLSTSLNQPQEAAKIVERCNSLQQFLRNAQEKAHQHQENYFGKEESYFEEYFAMRRSQLRIMKDMIAVCPQITVEEDMVAHLRGLLQYTATTFAEDNDGQKILDQILEIYEGYRKRKLPQSREEFENRALLFQFLQSFSSFIEIKAEFFDENKTTLAPKKA